MALQTVSVDLRKSGEAPYPASVQDANYGMRWLKIKAPGGIGDPFTLGLLNSLSEGHVAILLGMRPDDARYNAVPLDGHTETDACVHCVGGATLTDQLSPGAPQQRAGQRPAGNGQPPPCLFRPLQQYRVR